MNAKEIRAFAVEFDRRAKGLSRMRASYIGGGSKGEMMPKARMAQIVAESVAVLCPLCGEPQPAQDGSEIWTHESFRANQGKPRPCVACDVPLIIETQSKVRFIFHEGK